MISHPTAHTIGTTFISLNWDAYKPALPMAFRLLPSFEDQLCVKKLAEERVNSYTPPNELPRPLLKADYIRTVEDVYLDVAWDHIARTRSLEILNAVQHDPGSSSALFKPSWVPRWDFCIGTPILGLYSSKHFASANKRVILTPPPGNLRDTLIIRGRLVTRIIKHTELLDSASFDLSLTQTTVGPESSTVQDRWITNPIANTWLANFKRCTSTKLSCPSDDDDREWLCHSQSRSSQYPRGLPSHLGSREKYGRNRWI